MRVLDDELVSEGKIHYLGASTMAAWQLMKALWTADANDYARFDVVQPLHHAGYYEDVSEYLDVCAPIRIWPSARTLRWRAGSSPGSTSAPIRTIPSR